VLGIGRTTVKKHLESTFTKLGVENRTSAAAMALEKLGSA
jgi:DNA-binding NarL/FixJ family response regulator